MHFTYTTYTKAANAKRAKVINIFHNTRLKLLRTNVAIWYNKTCRSKQLKAKYTQIKIKCAFVGNTLCIENEPLFNFDSSTK